VIGVGRSKDANNMVNNLRFETHLADAPALSRLTLRGKQALLPHTHILGIDYKLILLVSHLPIGHTNLCYPGSQVYLIYHAVERSITMIPSHPWS
jgi:hypothetical protein